MKILNFGSINLDHVYQVKSFVKPGETLSATEYKINFGGKGLNQSIALARCGAETYHANFIGNGAENLRDFLAQNNVNTSHMPNIDTSPGHAIIQVNEHGENCIILFGGANKALTKEHVTSTLSNFSENDILLIQNETNMLEEIITCAKKRGMKIAFNPAPFEDSVLRLPLELIDYFIVNEIEGAGFTGKNETEEILSTFIEMYPNTNVILTLGKKGAYFKNKDLKIYAPIYDAGAPVDTTAAGDTFTGYFLGSIANGESIENALEIASKASGLCVTNYGAAQSIPYLSDVNNCSD